MSESERLKLEAVKLLEAMFKIPEGYSSEGLRRVVDCIVEVVVLRAGEW